MKSTEELQEEILRWKELYASLTNDVRLLAEDNLELRDQLKHLLCEGHDAFDYKHSPDNHSCVLCDLKNARISSNL